MSITSLELPEHTRLDESIPGYPILEIRHPRAEARIALHGGHVMEWAPVGEKPVLYLSPDAVFRNGKAIRGGVPICWPWFNAHPTDSSKPSHGFARNRPWKLEKVEEATDSTSVFLSLKPDAATLKIWPHPFELRLRIRIGHWLTVSLEATNTGDEAFTMGGALHTYLAVGDVREATVSGLNATPILDTTVDPPASGQQMGDVTFNGEVDQIHQSAATVRLNDPALRRAITVEKEGSHSTVVWNPWIEKAAALSDLPDDGYQHFVCIEAALAGDDVRTLESGESHTLTTRLRGEFPHQRTYRSGETVVPE